jgi:hypothetical protein
MSAIKFQVGEPKKLILAFDEPKSGKNDYGKWYMYGFKNGDLSSEEDCFFATETLHSMIQTLGAKEGDEITIEKCQDLEMTFFKVNGLSINDMNSGGAIEKIEKAKPKNEEMEKLIAENKRLKEELYQLKDGKLSASDIPF